MKAIYGRDCTEYFSFNWWRIEPNFYFRTPIDEKTLNDVNPSPFIYDFPSFISIAEPYFEGSHYKILNSRILSMIVMIMSTEALESNIVAEKARSIFHGIAGKSFHTTSSVEIEEYQYHIMLLSTILAESHKFVCEEEIQAMLDELDRVEIQLEALYRKQ